MNLKFPENTWEIMEYSDKINVRTAEKALKSVENVFAVGKFIKRKERASFKTSLKSYIKK